MPVDVSLYNGLMQAPRSALDYATEFARADALRNQNALQAMTLRQNTLKEEGNLGVRNFLAGQDPSATLDQTIAGLRRVGTPEALSQADALDTAQQGRLKATAQAAKDNADAGQTTQNTAFAKADRAVSDITSLATPSDALQSLMRHFQANDIDANKFQSVYATLQPSLQDPSQFAQWKQSMVQGIMAAKDRMGYMTPDANAQLQATTSTANTAANNATSRANNSATIAAENERAAKGREVQLKLGGYDANGNLIGGDASGGMSGLVDSIGQYKSPESVALSRVPPALKSQVMAQVMQKYPDYDPSTYGAKQKAARDFSTGTQGNSMRSFAVAGQHLDQLGTLVDALDNGNTQLFNKIANSYSEKTGNPAPTNFDAAKDVVSKEVVKAIVAGGGGVAEREELSRLMDSAKSPAQLKGVIQQYRNLMGAQHDALLQQRRAAGLPDSTLPNYGDTAAPAAVPTGAFKITHIDGQAVQ